MATRKKPVAKLAAKATAKPLAKAAVKAPVKVAPPVVQQPGLPNLAPHYHVAGYRGAVPVKGFVGWMVLVVLALAAGGFLAAQVLVSQRMGQLLEETAARVGLQAQNRAATVGEWMNGLGRVVNDAASADVVRLWVADKRSALNDAGLAQAVRAQTPYMKQILADFVTRRGFVGAHVVGMDGQVILSEGQLPSNLANAVGALKEISRSAKGQVMPARMTEGGPVIDILRPILAQEGNTPAGTPAVLGVIWASAPVGQRVADLTAATPLDRAGERTTLVQIDGDTMQVLGRTALADLETLASEFQAKLSEPQNVTRSPMDGEKVFAALEGIEGTPLALLQEYRADDALGVMGLYKPGLYTVVALLTGLLGALMLALVLHLMAQRNTTRVKLLGQTMDALVRVVEARDPYLAGHHAKVARLTLSVANAMKMGVGERATLYYAAQLAAVGRLLVPREILGKKGQYSAAEREAMQSHMTQALAILGDLDFDLPIVPVIAQMYERVDGSGFPRALVGHQMHKMAKVLGAADAYTAMTSDRVHRKALSKVVALEQMSGGGFDERVLEAVKAVAR